MMMTMMVREGAYCLLSTAHDILHLLHLSERTYLIEPTGTPSSIYIYIGAREPNKFKGKVKYLLFVVLDEMGPGYFDVQTYAFEC